MTFIALSKSQFAVRYCLSNKLRKWIMIIMLFLCSTVLTLLFLSIAPAYSHRRPETRFIYFNRSLCALSAAENTNQRTAVIVVLSARTNFDRRNVIRQTYGSIKSANNVRILAVVFMLGNSDENGAEKADIERLKDEMYTFGDIVMGDFVDSYRNLTLKTIMGYEWLTSHCRQAQFVVKTDDDVIVNIFHLTKEIDALSSADVASSNIWCSIHWNVSIVTDVESKFYASPIDFPDGQYPVHCPGLGYVTVIGVIDRIVDEISRSFPGEVCTHEDVFMTSIVLERINSIQGSFSIKPRPIELVNRREDWEDFTFENGKGDEDHFVTNFVLQTSNENKTMNLKEFRKRRDTQIFYLLAHSDDLTEIYVRLWAIIKESFRT